MARPPLWPVLLVALPLLAVAQPACTSKKEIGTPPCLKRPVTNWIPYHITRRSK